MLTIELYLNLKFNQKYFNPLLEILIEIKTFYNKLRSLYDFNYIHVVKDYSRNFDK
jgi:hypothetical protein